MPGVKRAAAEPATNASKRVRYSEAGLEDLPKPILIAHVLELQDHVTRLESAKPPTSPDLSDAQLSEKADQARKLMVKGIKSQMKA